MKSEAPYCRARCGQRQEDPNRHEILRFLRVNSLAATNSEVARVNGAVTSLVADDVACGNGGSTPGASRKEESAFDVRRFPI